LAALKRSGGLTLDSGALIAAEKEKDIVRAFLTRARERWARITVPAPVLAQVWRKNNAAVARILEFCAISVLDAPMAKRVGALLANARTKDIVDAMVVVVAAAGNDIVLTSDPDDITRLADAAKAPLRIHRV
jgi:hypothetical protein